MFNDKSNVYGMRTSLSMSIINDDPFFCPYTNISTITNAIVSTVSKQQNYMEPYATEYTHEIGKKPIMKHLPKQIVTCKWRLLYSTAVNMKCQILIGCVYMCIHHIFVDNWFTGPVCSHNEHVQYIGRWILYFCSEIFSVSALFIGAKRCMKNDFIYWNFSQK